MARMLITASGTFGTTGVRHNSYTRIFIPSCPSWYHKDVYCSQWIQQPTNIYNECVMIGWHIENENRRRRRKPKLRWRETEERDRGRAGLDKIARGRQNIGKIENYRRKDGADGLVWYQCNSCFA